RPDWGGPFHVSPWPSGGLSAARGEGGLEADEVVDVEHGRRGAPVAVGVARRGSAGEERRPEAPAQGERAALVVAGLVLADRALHDVRPTAAGAAAAVDRAPGQVVCPAALGA